MSGSKAIIKNVDMSDELLQETIETATQGLEQFTIEKDIAAYIKKEFDKKHGPTWHCIVGRHFGSYVTHETKHFVYFYLGKLLTKFDTNYDTLLKAFQPLLDSWEDEISLPHL